MDHYDSCIKRNLRGIRLELPNESGTLVFNALKPVNFSKYDWHLDYVEIHCMNNLDYQAFPRQPVVLSGNIFKEMFNKGPYYAVFGEVIAYPSGAEMQEIKTYKDYLESNAELVLLVVDVIYYDIYCKDDTLLHGLYNNAANHGYKTEYIDNNDTRTALKVF